jgi:UDP-2-acetamido-3-amino-2,3-dideoxy-glucuronate N-acetyltransferase
MDAHMISPDVDVREHGYFAHGTAIVESGARVGAGTRIWHHAHVRADAQIGDNCTLGKGVFVDAGAIIGNGCKVQNNVSVYVGVRLDDDVFVGPSAVFTNDLRPRAATADWTVVPTHVGAGASIGANATIVCGNDIGHHAMVAAGAVVTRSVRDHELVAGNPARHLGWVCWCGEMVTREVDPPDEFTCALHRRAQPDPAPASNDHEGTQ